MLIAVLSPDRVDRELSRIVADANTDATSIGGDVIDPVRDGFTKFLVNEIMHVDHLSGQPSGR